MPGLTAAYCPFQNPKGFRHIVIRIRQQRDAGPVFRGGLSQLRGRIKGNADKGNIESLKVRVVLQINDLLKARRSTKRHVKVQQHRLFTAVIG